MRILIVDDEPFVSNGLRQNIQWEKLGVDSIDTADDGMNALKKIGENTPDIIITDIRMPRMNGIELALKIRKINPTCKIIFLTAYSDKEYLKSAINLQAFSYIEKPINVSEITKKLHLAIASRKKEQIEFLLTKNNIISELVKHSVNEGQIRTWLSNSKISLNLNGCFAVLVTSFGENTEENYEYFDEAIHTAILKRREEYIVLSAFDGDYLVTVINTEKRETITSAALEYICRETSNTLKTKTRAFISAGKAVCGIPHIKDSYQDALRAQEFWFYTGFGHYKLGQDCIENKNEPIHGEAYIAKLDELLENKNQNEAIILVKNIAHQCKHTMHIPAGNVRSLYSRLMMVVVNRANKINISIFSPDAGTDYISYIGAKNTTLDEIAAYIIHSIKTYFSKMDSYLANNAIVADIYKIVNREYGNIDLSVSSISNRLHLSRNHISTTFKDKTGKTIHEYITEYRLGKAKELLGSRDGRLSEIAQKIGYRDHNYFTKVFHKAFGINPSEYRRKHQIR
mgnify:CR=1 FL=1